MDLPEEPIIVDQPPEDCISLAPYFPNHAITSDGLYVYRVKPARRGKMAGKIYELPVQQHPNGKTFHVMLRDESGKNHRLSVERLQRLAVKLIRDRIDAGMPEQGDVLGDPESGFMAPEPPPVEHMRRSRNDDF